MNRFLLYRFAILVTSILFIASCSHYSVNEPPVQTSETRPGALAKIGGQGDPAVLAWMNGANQKLASQGMKIAVESVEFFTIGVGRPDARIHQAPFRWVPNDQRRLADGDRITYMFDQSHGATASGLTSAQTEAAVDRALSTWAGDPAMSKLTIVKRPYTGSDPSIVDGMLGFGGTGNPFLADIVDAGWYPRAFFEVVGGPGGGRGILGVTFTFIFVDGNGIPTDINGDNYLDEALSETYYNDNFGDPSGDRAGNPWGIDVVLPGIDVQTVALHENGHDLDLGHFGPPPTAVMNPVYAGIRQSPFPSDDAGLSALWKNWPNP